MRTKLCAFLCLLVLPFAAMGQFIGGDDGGGSSKPAWTEFKLNAKKRIKLDFHNASVDAIVTFFQNQSGVTIVKDPALTGTLTVTSATAVSLNDAFQILSTNLGLKNYEIGKDNKLMVIRQKQARGNRDGFPSGIDMTSLFPPAPKLQVYVIKYANASQIARVLNDVFSSTGDPMQNLMQMMQGAGGRGGFGNQGGRGGRNGGGFGGGANPFANFRGGAQTQSTVRASSDDFSNSVIVNASTQQQAQVADLIRQLDRETDEPQKSKVFKLTFASSDDLTPVVQNVLNSNAPRGRGGATTGQSQGPQAFINALRGSTAGAGQVTSDPRTNSLIVTATDENLAIVDKVVKELDTEVKTENATFVVPLQNARADLMAALLQQAFGTRQGLNGGGTNRTGTTTNTGNRNTTTNRNTGGNNGSRPPGLGGSADRPVALAAPDGKNLQLALEDPNADSGELMTSIGVQQGGGFNRLLGGGGQQRQGSNSNAPTGRSANGQLVNIRDLTNQITVIPDTSTNSLIIVTTPDGAQLIKSIVEQLDKIPEQVMIETIIVEASLDATDKFGVEWNYSSTHKGVTNSVGQTFGIQNSATNPPTGFKYTLAGGALTAFLNAVENDTRFTILSTPRIFTSNNSPATINISQSIPYVLSSIQDTNGNLSFNYAFLDVGIILTVTPRITSNGYVTMDVTQTANDLQSFTSFNAPIVNQREADTTVSVKDGETIILGGIIRNNVTTTTNKIPLLGDIPILGNLFRSTSHEKTKTELMVFLTPHVVRNPDDAAKLRETEMKQLSPNSHKSVDGLIIPPKDQTPPPTKGSDKTTPPPTGH